MSLSLEELRERAWQVRAVCRLQAHRDYVSSLAFAPDGRYLASASGDRTVRLWSVPDGARLNTFGGHGRAVSSVWFSPDGCFVLAGGFDKTVRVWSSPDGMLRHMITDECAFLNSASSSAGRWLLATESADDSIQLWEPSSGRPVRMLRGHQQLVTSLCLSPDGSLLVACTNDTAISLWRTDTGELISTRQTDDEISCIAISPNGRYLASGAGASSHVDKAVRLWELPSGRELRVLYRHANTPKVTALAWSPDGSLLASRPNAKSSAPVALIHVDSGQLVRTLPQDPSAERASSFNALAFSPDGHYLATYARDNLYAIELWDVSALDVGPKRSE